MRLKLFFIFLVSFSFVQAQHLVMQEDSLVLLLKKVRNSTSNQEKEENNRAFQQVLEKTILMKGAFDYPFNRLNSLGKITSPDNTFRIFTWNVEQEDLTQKYYCYILRFDDRKDEYYYIELKDDKLILPPRPTETLKPAVWYGALYYEIIPMDNRSKDMYTVLGWIGNNNMSTMKVVDVFTFRGKNLRIGSPIIYVNDEKMKRYFMEYAKKTTIHLGYEKQYDRIIFDHLVPEVPSLEGVYSMYIPDLTYDAFVADNGKWRFKENVVATNSPDSEKISITYVDKKTGELKTKEVKNKWIKPSETHVAKTPEDELNEEKEQQKDKLNADDNMKSRDAPGSYNPLNKVRKRKRR